MYLHTFQIGDAFRLAVRRDSQQGELDEGHGAAELGVARLHDAEATDTAVGMG